MQTLQSKLSFVVGLALLASCTYDASKLVRQDAMGDDGTIDQQPTGYGDTGGSGEAIIRPDGGADFVGLADTTRFDSPTVADAGVDLPPALPDIRVEAASPPDLDFVDVPPIQRDSGTTQSDAVLASDSKVEEPDALVVHVDTISINDTQLLDATSVYTSNGVTANLGVNPCYTAYDRAHPPSTNNAMGGGWDPATGKCYTPTWPVMSGICGSTPTCGTYAPGTLLIWDASDVRFRYLGDSSGGVVCLPNNIPYIVPCS